MGGATRFFVLLTTPFPLLHHRTSSLHRLSRHHKLLLSPSVLSSSSFHQLTSFPSNTSLLPPSPLNSSRHLHNQTASSLRTDFYGDPSLAPHHTHPWPEWSTFIHHISASGYFQNRPGEEEDGDFVAAGDLTHLFLREARASLAFARDRQNILRLLSRRDIELVVEHGSPFLFRNAEDSVRKMRSFIANSTTSVLDSDKAHMVDLMKFMLSYASNPLVSSERNNVHNRDLVESSVRNLFAELFKLICNAPGSNSYGSVQNQMPGRVGQKTAPGQKIEMKRGDWICPRCNFMNFARNIKCLECEEARPKRQLAGGEWECPQCDFFNYGKNITCIRCDCKRPGQKLGATNTLSGMGYGNGGNTITSDIDDRLAANEEKAQRWFSKVSQLDSTTDINSVISDEDFPEIMPLRKGVNRFVVSTKKTPLERRLTNTQYQRNLGNDDTPEFDDFQAGEVAKDRGTSISQSLDDIFGCPTGLSQSDNDNVAYWRNTNTNSLPSISSNSSPQYRDVKGSNSSFVPLPGDMFAQKSEDLKTEESKKEVPETDVGSNNFGDSLQLTSKSTSQIVSEDKEKEQAEKSENWFRKVSELHNISDLTSAIPDEDFPEVMPMRKGENRFVVSKKKDRSLTSPAYKRQLAMEQAGNTNFVPFVPFPPDYFARKDKQPSDGSLDKPNIESTPTSEVAEKLPEMSDDTRHGTPNAGYVQGLTNVGTSSFGQGLQRRDRAQATGKQDVSMKDAVHGTTTSGNSSQSYASSQSVSSFLASDQNIRAQWTGKSLEGSAVKEPDPLDMSEEAKAERWFRRVAQIKDISELSQIPDEDFPSIMPMRKGVNRFVVSKRKTPLERRLTSQQYRKNLPIVSSDPIKKDEDS